MEEVVTLDATSGASTLPGQKEKSPNANCVQTQSVGNPTARGLQCTVASLAWCIFCGCQSIPVGQWGQSGQRKVYMPVSPRTNYFSK